MSTAAEPKSGSKSKNGLKNLAIGAAIQVFEVSTLGQPFEVVKTHMAGTLYILSEFPYHALIS